MSVTRPLHGIPQPTDLRLWLPLGFAASSFIVYAMAARLQAGDGRGLLSLDLVAWLALPACIVACRLHGSWTPAWLTAALAVKTLACLVAIVVAARTHAGQRLAGLAISALFLTLSLVALPYTRYPGMPNELGLAGDEPFYLAETAALLYDHSFYIGHVYGSEIFARILGHGVGNVAALPAAGQAWYVGGGHYAPAHDLGLSMLAVPLFAAGGKVAVEIAMAVLAAATVYLTYRLVLAVGVRSEVAVVAVAASCFLLPFLPYATQVFPEIPIAFVGVAAACYLAGVSRSRAAYLGVSVLLAVLPWIHVRAWGLLLPLLVGIALSEKSWLRRALAPAAVVVSEIAYLVLLRLIYGHFMIVHPEGSVSAELSGMTAIRLLIAVETPFLDPDNGLFLIAPVFLIAFAAWPALVRQRRVWWPIVIAVATYCFEVGITRVVGVSAAYSPPGRLTVACVPLLAPALALGLVALRRRGLSPLFWLLVGYGSLLAFDAFANRTAAYLPGTLRVLATLLGIRGPTITVVGAGPWYGALLTVAVLLGLALLIGLGRGFPGRFSTNEAYPAPGRPRL